MLQRAAGKIFVLSLAFLSTLIASAAPAATWTAFGPEVVVRGTGAPKQVTRMFSVLNPSAKYVLEIQRSSARPSPQSGLSITLNGARVVTLPESESLPIYTWPVRLNSANQLVIELRGAPGDSVTIKIVGVDVDAPTISGIVMPTPPASGWLKTNATVTFTCADATSGIASCTSPVTVNTEGAARSVIGTATDNAGNQSSTSVTVNLDKTAPTIQAALNPQPNAAGWNTGPVTVTFACADGLSGVASCTPPVTVGTPGSHTVNGIAIDRAGNQASLNTTVKVATSLFALRNYGGKCLDAGPLPQAGGGVYLNTCNGSAGQQFRVEEMTPHHHVRLYAGSTVIGIDYDPSPVIDDGSGNGGLPEGPLKLQVPADANSINLSIQLFVLDGDSIIASLDRNYVAQVDNARGANGTPIVLRKRRLADAEFWDFLATDGSDVDPTRGFVRVETRCDLLRHLALRFPGQPPEDPDCAPGGPATPAGPGTVVKIAPGAVLDLAGLYPVQLPAGVTLRGGSRGMNFGARLCKAYNCDQNEPMDVPEGFMLEVTGSDVRITGLRLEGPRRQTEQVAALSRAVYAREEHVRTIIDHNDISGWNGAGIEVNDENTDTACTLAPPLFSNVFVARNFIHHNRQQEKGYGVVSANGGFPLIEGNTFLANRHAIAATGNGPTGYFARFNLVLSEVPLQDGLINWYTHDFDQHGNGNNGFGGDAGRYNRIFDNTFFGANRVNYKIRGYPCYKTDFGYNVSRQSEDATVDFEPFPLLTKPESEVVNFIGNHFDAEHPANRLGVGDFDGDGTDDLFLATGAAWYFSPGGAREWRYLRGTPAPLSLLRFGDFDGDGRTDVVGVSGGDLLVSWGGVSNWERLNAAPGFVVDLAVGKFVSDFPGDRRDDLFYTNGTSWFVSSGGSGPFLVTQTSSLRVAELRFGDFDADGVTDVFGVTNNIWQVSYSATSFWTPLAASLTTSIDNLFVADFDGDGRADIARVAAVDATSGGGTISVNTWTLWFWRAGATGWVPHDVKPTASCGFVLGIAYQDAGLLAGIANVDDIPGADLLLWGAKDGNNFCLVSGGTGAAVRRSSQDMR